MAGKDIDPLLHVQSCIILGSLYTSSYIIPRPPSEGGRTITVILQMRKQELRDTGDFALRRIEHLQSFHLIPGLSDPDWESSALSTVPHGLPRLQPGRAENKCLSLIYQVVDYIQKFYVSSYSILQMQGRKQYPKFLG